MAMNGHDRSGRRFEAADAGWSIRPSSEQRCDAGMAVIASECNGDRM
jgi:hypothetical protein